MEYDPKQLFHHITLHVLALFRISLYVSSCPHIYTYIMHVSSQHLSEVLHKSAAKYPSSQNHGSVENGYIWKVTILLEGSIFDWTMGGSVPNSCPCHATCCEVLKTSGGFHTSLMEPAKAKLGQASAGSTVGAF